MQLIQINLVECHPIKCIQPKVKYPRICPYRSAVPNRHTSPSNNKHTTSNSHQMPDKTSKDHLRNTKIRAIFLFVLLPHMHKSPRSCKQRSTWFLFTVYMCIVRKRRQALLLKLIDMHPSPCTRALRFC